MKDLLKPLPQTSLSHLLFEWILAYHLAIYALKPGFLLHKASELVDHERFERFEHSGRQLFQVVLRMPTQGGSLSR